MNRLTSLAPLLALLVLALATAHASADSSSSNVHHIVRSSNSKHGSSSNKKHSSKKATTGGSSNSTSSSSSSSSSKSNSKGKGKSSSSKSKSSNNDSSSNNSTSSAKKSSKGSSSSSSSGGGGSGKVGDSSDKNFSLSNLPKTWQDGQQGTNQCNQWGDSSQSSMCQNVFFNALDDFCLWAPPSPGAIGDTERLEVAWCLKPGYGTRLIPAGAIKAAHFVKTKEYVQLTGTGDLTLLNVPAGDTGGELDPHGADGNGNPIGGLVFTNAFDGQYQQVHEWMTFISDQQFCFRACKGRGKTAQALCQHIYDTMGCAWVIPANYGEGFESCEGAVADPPGIVGTSTFTQGDKVTPAASPAPSSSQCSTSSSLSAAFTASTSATSAAGGSRSSSSSGSQYAASSAASLSSGLAPLVAATCLSLSAAIIMMLH